MMTVKMDDFLADNMKYFNYAREEDVEIENMNGELFRLAIQLHEQEKEQYYDPTLEELEIIRQGEENRAKGEYYKKLPGETTEEFFERILSNPEKEMVCNRVEWKNSKRFN